MAAGLVLGEGHARRRKGTHASRLVPAVRRPVGHVVEDDGLFAIGCVVEFTPTDSSVGEFESANKLVVVDGLIFEKAGGCLDDEDALRIASQSLEHDAPESVVACVGKRDGLLRCDGCGIAVDGVFEASV